MNLNTATHRIVQTVALLLILAICIQTSLLSTVMAASENDQRAAASIGGEVFMDGNRNATREPLEAGISGARVVLSTAAGEIMAEATTDDEGYYSFANLDVDTYQLEIFPPAGYIVSSNGTLSIQVREVSAPVIYSTAVSFGILLPFVPRYPNHNPHN